MAKTNQTHIGRKSGRLFTTQVAHSQPAFKKNETAPIFSRPGLVRVSRGVYRPIAKMHISAVLQLMFAEMGIS